MKFLKKNMTFHFNEMEIKNKLKIKINYIKNTEEYIYNNNV